MYNPSSGIVSMIMRWPLLGGVVASIAAVNTNGWLSLACAFVAGAVIGAYFLYKYFKKYLCDCEKNGYIKPEVQWIVEYSPETGHDRPWDVYTMVAGLEQTKQHYASYSTEEAAMKKIEALKKS